ncbi:MAG: DUF4298 domain-containing protein [Bacteroidota bacterium]|nr:DUF4298 domain-containing protein [Bacteroidota bacterium]
MDEKRLQNIREMEEILNKIEQFTPQARQLLEQWEGLFSDIQKLSDYYHGEQWMADHEASSRGEIPKDMPHGVLSQDLAYDALGDQYLLAVDFLKLITRVISRE